MTGDPVAWQAIERGWPVYDAAGSRVGYVDHVTGDPKSDIFNGIAFGDGGTVLTRTRYVPAEQVAAIREGEVVLQLGPEEAAALEPFTETVSKPLAELLPEPDRPEEDERSVRTYFPFGGGVLRMPRRKR